MAAPIADETLNEWLELYNNGSNSIDVSGYIIADESGNDTLEGGYYSGSGTIIPAYGYAIITDQDTKVYNNFNCSTSAIKLYTDDSSIGNGLRNSGENLSLYNNQGNLVYSITYPETENGKCYALLNTGWQETECTPGYSNNGSIASEETETCDWKIELLLNKTIFGNKDDFEWKMRASKLKGQSTNLTGTAKIEDFFGNIIKEYRPWTNDSAVNQKTSSTYSPSLSEGNAYLITTNLETSCNDDNSQNNIAQKIFIIQGASQQTNQLGNSSDSYITIEDIYDLNSKEKAKFGQSIRVKLKIYKGDTRKEVITLWIEGKGNKVSKESKVYAQNKYSLYELTVPIQFKPNCNLKYDDGKYKIQAEGLDTTTEKDIRVEGIDGDLCEKETESKSTSSDFYYELINWPSEIENNKEFEIKIRLDNNDDQEHKIEIWSYIYRGPKSYSGDREFNKEQITLNKRSSKEIILRNIVSEAEPGEYTLMVKIKKDDQKTEKQVSQNIKIIQKSSLQEEKEVIEEKTELHQQKEEDSIILESTKQPKIVYESTSAKAQKLITCFFIGLLVIYSSILTWKR